MKTISIKDSLYKDVSKLASQQKIEMKKLLEEALQQGFNSIKEKYILELYRNHRITLAKGAEMLSIDMWEMIEKIKKSDLHLDYGEEDLREDLSL